MEEKILKILYDLDTLTAYHLSHAYDPDIQDLHVWHVAKADGIEEAIILILDTFPEIRFESKHIKEAAEELREEFEDG